MMLTEKLQIFTRIYKQFDHNFSLICYYSFIFGLLRISIVLSVFRFVSNKYQWRAIWLLLTIRNIRSAIWWSIPKVILNYLRLPTWQTGSKISNKVLATTTSISEGCCWMTGKLDKNQPIRGQGPMLKNFLWA